MKKTLILLACILLTLCGCSDASAKITNGNEAVVTLGGKTYSRQDLYSFMTNYGGSYFAVSNAQKIILDNEVQITDEMTQNVDSTMDLYATMLGDSFESYLQSQGFADTEDYREMLIQNEQLQQLYVKYTEANYDTLAQKYTPRKIQLMKFDNEETAQAALEAVNNGQDFAEVATEKGSLVDGASQLVTSSSTFETVVQYAITTQTAGVIGDVIANDDGSAYYLLLVNSSDPAELKDEAVAAIATISAIADESIQYYFKEYDFRIYDIDLYNQVYANYSDLLNQ